MNRFLLLLLASFVLASAAFATPTTCQPGLLSAYLGTGFSCTINSLTFDQWGYVSTATGSANSITSGSINVNPVTTLGDEGFQFSAGWIVNNTGGGGPSSTIDSLVSFTATGAGIGDLELFFNGSITGTGASGVTEQYCLNHALIGCAGSHQISVTNPPPGFNDQVFFAPAGSVSVSKDIFVATGSNGSAFISQVANNFSSPGVTNFSSPEPLSFVLLGSGLLGLGLLRKRIKR
jgi:hypothetical protein